MTKVAILKPEDKDWSIREHELTCRSYYKTIGCELVESAFRTPTYVAYVDEEGKIKDEIKPSALRVDDQGRIIDILAGTIIAVGQKYDGEGEIIDVEFPGDKINHMKAHLVPIQSSYGQSILKFIKDDFEKNGGDFESLYAIPSKILFACLK